MSIKYRVEYFKEMCPLKDISSFIDFALYDEAYDFLSEIKRRLSSKIECHKV